MNASDMLDQATLIIARQDVTGTKRAQLLMFMNTARKAVLRDNTIRKFFDYRTLPTVSGVIDGYAQGVKFLRTVEYNDGFGNVTKLTRFKSLDEARSMGFTDLTILGTPSYYLEIGTDIYILPVLTSGSIQGYGEFWPTDLIDSPTSSDVLTAELPEAFVYLAAAEYLDMTGESDRGGYWRQKGSGIVAAYRIMQASKY